MKRLKVKLLIPIAIASIALVAGACSGTDTFVDTSLTNRVETSASTSTETTLAEVATTTTEPRTETRVVGHERCRAIRWTELFEAPFEACLETIEVPINDNEDLGPYVPIELPESYTPEGYVGGTGNSYIVNYIDCNEGYSITRLIARDTGGPRFIITDSGNTPLSEPPRGDECFDRCYISYKTFFATDDNVALTRLCRYETGFAFAPYSEGEALFYRDFYLDDTSNAEEKYIQCAIDYLTEDGCDIYYDCFAIQTYTNLDYGNTQNTEELSPELLSVIQKYIDRLPSNAFNNILLDLRENEGFSPEYFINGFERVCAYTVGSISNRDTIRISATPLHWFKEEVINP